MTLQHGDQFASELLTCHAVEEEIDGVIDKRQLIVDRLGDVIREVVLGPAVLADEHDDAWEGADEEGEGHAQAHDGRLDERLVGSSALVEQLTSDFDERADDHAVGRDEDAEWKESDQGECQPGTDLRLKILELLHFPAI